MQPVNIRLIKNLCKTNSLRWTNHIITRLMQRNISLQDISYALLNGEIIEEYPADYPYPSCLVLGATIGNEYIHVVCGFGTEELWLITAYYPDPQKWSNDFKSRKEL